MFLLIKMVPPVGEVTLRLTFKVWKRLSVGEDGEGVYCVSPYAIHVWTNVMKVKRRSTSNKMDTNLFVCFFLKFSRQILVVYLYVSYYISTIS